MRNYSIAIEFAVFEDSKMTEAGLKALRDKLAKEITQSLRIKGMEVDGIDTTHGKGEITIYIR